MQKITWVVILILTLMTAGCDSPKKEAESSGPKTTYGRAIEKAHDASDISDRRNDEMKKQADALKDAEAQ